MPLFTIDRAAVNKGKLSMIEGGSHRMHSLVLELFDRALTRLEKAHTALLLEKSSAAQLVQSARTDLGVVRDFWCGEGPNIDVALSLRTIAKNIESLNHPDARGAYQDLREAEGIVQDNTVEGIPISG